MQFVNLGMKSRYLHTNRPDQFYDFVLTLVSDPQVRALFKLRKQHGIYVDDHTIHAPVGNLQPGAVISNSILEPGVTIDHGGITMSSVLENGTVIDTQGAIVNSVGRFIVPEGAIVDSVIAPAEGVFQVKPHTFTRGYLIKAGDGKFKQVIVSIPIRLMVPDEQGRLRLGDLKTKVAGVRLSTMKVFPRESHLTDALPTTGEQSDGKYSLDDLRNLDLHSIWALQKTFNGFLQDPNADVTKAARYMRNQIVNLNEYRSELREEKADTHRELLRALEAKDQSRWDFAGKMALGLRAPMAMEYSQNVQTPHLFVVEWDESLGQPESIRTLLSQMPMAGKIAVYITPRGIGENSYEALKLMAANSGGRMAIVVHDKTIVTNLSQAVREASQMLGIVAEANDVASIHLPSASELVRLNPQGARMTLDTSMRLAYDPNELNITSTVIVIGQEDLGYGKHYQLDINRFIHELQVSAAAMEHVAESA
jgi:hypothetical protein